MGRWVNRDGFPVRLRRNRRRQTRRDAWVEHSLASPQEVLDAFDQVTAPDREWAEMLAGIAERRLEQHTRR